MGDFLGQALFDVWGLTARATKETLFPQIKNRFVREGCTGPDSMLFQYVPLALLTIPPSLAHSAGPAHTACLNPVTRVGVFVRLSSVLLLTNTCSTNQKPPFLSFPRLTCGWLGLIGAMKSKPKLVIQGLHVRFKNVWHLIVLFLLNVKLLDFSVQDTSYVLHPSPHRNFRPAFPSSISTLTTSPMTTKNPLEPKSQTKFPVPLVAATF